MGSNDSDRISLISADRYSIGTESVAPYTPSAPLSDSNEDFTNAVPVIAGTDVINAGNYYDDESLSI